MTKLTLLVLGDRADPRMAALARVPDGVRVVFGERPQDFGEALTQAEALLCWWRGREALDPVLAAAPALRWVHSSAAGLDHMVSTGLASTAAVVTNSRGVYGAALAEYVLAAMLYFVKDLARLRDAQTRRAWEPFECERLAGKTLAIVGYGDIGAEIAARASALGVQVLAYRRRPELSARDPHVTRVVASLRDAIAPADFVVLAAPLTPDTRHMIGAEQLSWMRDSAVLINVGRGQLIDEPALVHALQRRALRGAALDVFETEPLPAENPLWAMPQVLLSPHSADRVEGWLDLTMALFLTNLEKFVRGEPLLNIVDPRRGY
jgi:phosphoglycerate dehydrogenase-like enzyme